MLNEDSPRETLIRLTRLAQRQESARRWLEQAFEGRLDQLALPALDVAVETGDPVGRALARQVEESCPFDLAVEIMGRCLEREYRRSVPLRELALAATEKVRAGFLDTVEPQENRREIAGLAENRSHWLGSLGRQEKALEASREAVALYRRLTGEQPGEYRAELARSLGGLGQRLDQLGRWEEAHEAFAEAVDLCRRLAGERRDDFRPDLAHSLANLALALRSLERREKSLAANREAVEIYRQLARERPAAFRPDLARILGNLAVALDRVGRHEEALDREAVELYRGLARDRPEACEPLYALGLHNLGERLLALDRPEEALESSEKAVRLLLPHCRRHPAAFGHWLAEMEQLSQKIVATAGIARDPKVANQVAEAISRSRAEEPM